MTLHVEVMSFWCWVKTKAHDFICWTHELYMLSQNKSSWLYMLNSWALDVASSCKSWGLKIQKNTLFLTNMWENTSKWWFLGVFFSHKTSWDFEHLMRFRAQNLMSFWKAHEFCRLNLMTSIQKPHEFLNSSWDFMFKAHEFYMKSSWVYRELMT